MQRKIRTVFMRGGTSRALFFHDKDLPSDPEVRARVILAAYDSPDSYGRQIDGRGVLLPHLRKYSYGGIANAHGSRYDEHTLTAELPFEGLRWRFLAPTHGT